MALVTVKMLGEAAWMTFARNKFSDEFDKIAFARDRSNYDDVVSFTVGLEGEEAAEEAFDLSNNPSRQANRDIIWGERRSLSVGDVVEVWEGTQVTAYLCDSFGWLEV